MVGAPAVLRLLFDSVQVSLLESDQPEVRGTRDFAIMTETPCGESLKQKDTC